MWVLTTTRFMLTFFILWGFFSRRGVCESYDLIHWQLQLLWLQWHWVERWVGRKEVTKVIPRKQVTQTLNSFLSHYTDLSHRYFNSICFTILIFFFFLFLFLSMVKDEHGIEKISQTFTCQSGRPTLSKVTNKEASSPVPQSDPSWVFNGWDHRGINLHCLLMLLQFLH